MRRWQELAEITISDRKEARGDVRFVIEQTAGGGREERVKTADRTRQSTDYSDLTAVPDTTERDDSTPGTSHHTAGAGQQKMAPKRATRSTPATTTTDPTATTNVTNAQLQAMINEGVSAALAARDATRNGTDSHSSGTGVRGSERSARE
ncbi:hypothetical protein Tco_0629500 [Tanacetum coccineum]|uniref:Uncharacterized protein n=1 Tax=Tanacetum coccineum TaxID=301880 RepID=A0ABQ4WTJ3_9ASTR